MMTMIELARLLEPGAVAKLDQEATLDAIAAVAGLQARLQARLVALQTAQDSHLQTSNQATLAQALPNPDRMLDAGEVAMRLNISVGEVYRRRFPFAVKLGRRTTRYSERGLNEYLESR